MRLLKYVILPATACPALGAGSTYFNSLLCNEPGLHVVDRARSIA